MSISDIKDELDLAHAALRGYKKNSYSPHEKWLDCIAEHITAKGNTTKAKALKQLAGVKKQCQDAQIIKHVNNKL
jgi:hypothetical protein